MTSAKNFSTAGFLRDGRRIEIRAQRPDDQAGLAAAVERASAQSLFRRFFVVKRHFSDREVAFFTNVDFVKHVALVAVAEENGRPVIVGGGRYVVVRPGRAEIAFAIVDQYQGQGIGTELMRHLVANARAAGLEEFVAEVLPDNAPMLRVLEKSGLPLSTRPDDDTVNVVLKLR